MYFAMKKHLPEKSTPLGQQFLEYQFLIKF